jgi:hypothetical protein
MDSDNPTGADNQQETTRNDPRGILRDCTPGTQDQPLLSEGTVRPSWRHEEPDRNDLATALIEGAGVTRVPKVAKFLVG